MKQSFDPSVSYLEEIGDQNVKVAGGIGFTDLLTTLTCVGVSWIAGNNGLMCTVTAECQSSCANR